jgi:hypothetical protein
MTDSKPRTFSRAGFHARWDAIIGVEAADLMFRAWKARAFFAYSLLLSAVVAILAGFLHSYRIVHDVLVAVCIALFVSAITWAAIWRRRLPLQYEAASQFLGVEVSGRNFPPFNPKSFAKWRARQAITPGTSQNRMGPGSLS